jgi:hypothetical protein
MKYEPKSTLAFFSAAPQLQRIDISHLPIAPFAQSCAKFKTTCGMAKPTEDAVDFYTLNHLVSLLRTKFTAHEPMPDWADAVEEKYLKVIAEQGNRMFYYLLTICTREMRHLKTDKVTEAVWTKIRNQCGQTMVDWMKTVHTFDENTIQKRLFQTPPDVTLGQYMEAHSILFHQKQGSGKAWPNTSYGGPKWGGIVDTAMSFIQGNTSMETMMDNSFALEHNTCSMFNKGMMYSSYDHQLKVVLDVQRSGQMPELVLDPAFPEFKPVTIIDSVKAIAQQYPADFRGWVDWFKVESLGSVGSYSSNKAKQKQLHPDVPQQTVEGGYVWKAVGVYHVWPGETLTKFNREKPQAKAKVKV